MNIRNPFTPMLVTFNPNYVFGRLNEITSLLQVVTADDPAIHAIYGIRTIGKTTILRYLKAEQGAFQHYADYVSEPYRSGEVRLLFVYLNFYRFQEDDNLLFILLEQLQEDIEAHNLDVDIPEFEEFVPSRQLFKLMRQLLTELHNRHIRVVFLLDDFDIPLGLLNEDDYGYLRNLGDYAVLIMATEQPLTEIKTSAGQDSATLLGILRPEAINLLTEQPARDLIIQRTQEAGLPFEGHEVDFLLHFAGRQPFLLTVACEYYFQMRVEHPELVNILRTEDGQRNLRAQFTDRVSNLPHVSRTLQRMWATLDEDEHHTLYDMTRSQSIQQAGNLANKALVYWNLEQNTYQVFSYLFTEYIHRRYAEGEVEETQTATELATTLSTIDRSVLLYVLNRPGEVCTFEEIMDGVWNNRDNKRALEAAVHRLRKHLMPGEEIKNVRGKGYMFVSDHLTDAY